MPSPSVGLIIAEYVCPTIGAILSTLTFSAPITALKSCIDNGSLGNLNPTPWAFMTGNTIGWLAYSYITLDLFVFVANAPGLIISIWLNVGAMKLQYHDEIIKYSSIQYTAESTAEGNETEDQSPNVDENSSGGNSRHKSPSSCTSHESKVIQIILLWMVILSVASLVPISHDEMKFVVGVSVNLNLVVFYAAPLSTVMTVLRTKSSATIHFWTMVMNTFNSFFWVIYSLAIQDYYILIPNGLGVFFGLLQMLMYMIYPHDYIAENNIEQMLVDGGESKDGEPESEII